MTQQRLADEVRGIDFKADDVAARVSMLPYTRAIVNETLRLYPPAYVIARLARAEDKIGETVISEGSLVLVAPWVLHRHRRFWSHPDAFDPDRYLGEPRFAHRHAFLPFGAGPRVCVGAQFALTEATLVLGMLIQRFAVSMAEEVPILPAPVVTALPDRSAMFWFRPRDHLKAK